MSQKMDNTFRVWCLFLFLAAFGQADILHHWNLDETSGTTVADYIGGNSGIVNQGTAVDLTAAGVVSTGVDFEGQGNGGGYIAASNIFTGNAARAISVWFNADEISGNQARLIGMGSGGAGQFDLTVENFTGPSIGLRYGNGNMAWSGAAEGFTISPDTWYHVVVQYDGTTLVADSTLEVYLNGTKLTRDGGNNNNSGQVLNTPLTDCWISRDSSGSRTFNGTIDDVQVYNAPLSAAEIQYLYNNPGLVLGVEPAAIDPFPSVGQFLVPVDSTLSWSVVYADGITPKFDVYLGTDPGSLALVSSRQTGLSYTPTEDLQLGTFYSWRVDVVDESVEPDAVYTGTVWDFSTWADAMKTVEWKLDSASLSGSDWITDDTSGAGNDGTFVNFSGTPVFDPDGVLGNCLELTGDDDGVLKEDAAYLPAADTEPWSMNLYVNLNGKPNDWTRIANLGDDYQRQLMVYRNSELAFIYQNKYMLLAGTHLDPDHWYMVTVTYDASYLKILIDGVEVASQLLPFGAGDELDPVTVLLHYADAGDFQGRIDEFTVWNNTLSTEMITQLAGQLPIMGDNDGSGDVMLPDFAIFAENWLTDNAVDLADLVLDDFQSYTGDTDPAFIAAWQVSVKGDSTVSLTTPSGGTQSMNLVYDLGVGRDAGVYRWFDVPVDLSQYDQLRLWIYKTSSSTGDDLRCKFIDIDTDATLWDLGQASLALGTVPVDTWFEWVIDLNQLTTWDVSASSVPYDRIKDLDGLHVEIYGENGGSGSMIIDDLQLNRTAPRCEESGFVSGDQNGDCRINMIDLSIFADHWLN